MTRLPALLTALLLSAAPALAEDPPITGTEWTLLAIDGKKVTAAATLTLAEDGKIAGQAPCNRYFTANTAALPALALDTIGATKMACEALEAEAAYFGALRAMTEAQVHDGHLILTGPDGRKMEYYRPETEDPPRCQTCPKTA